MNIVYTRNNQVERNRKTGGWVTAKWYKKVWFGACVWKKKYRRAGQ